MWAVSLYLSLLSHSPSSLPPPLTSFLPPSPLFVLSFITAFNSQSCNGILLYYVKITTKSGILQQHKYIIPKFPHQKVWAECGFISLQGPQWPGVRYRPGAAVLFWVLFQDHWLLEEPISMGHWMEIFIFLLPVSQDFTLLSASCLKMPP